MNPDRVRESVPTDVLQMYYRWLAIHPHSNQIQPEEFASIYRWGMSQALRLTASMAPQFEALRKLINFVDFANDHSECSKVIDELHQQLDTYMVTDQHR